MKSKIKYLIKKQEPSVWLLKLLAWLRLFLGNYVNLSESRPICFLMKFYCFFCCSAVCAIYSRYIGKKVFPVFFPSIAECVLIALVYLVFGDKLYLQFFSAIRTNDRIIGFKKTSLIPYYVYLMVFFTLTLRSGITIFGACFYNIPVPIFYVITFCVHSLDVNHLTIIVIFAVLHRRMKRLRIFLESNSVPINITGRNEVAISVKNTRQCLYYYNNLLDNLQDIEELLQYLLFINWSSHCLGMIAFSYSEIINSIIGNHFAFFGMFLIETALSITLVSCPAITAEATAHEVDQIRATLTQQLLRCSDGSLRFELETTLQYVSLRPFRFTIWRAVPLNIYLPFIVMGLCITYVIVLLQLTHFAA